MAYKPRPCQECGCHCDSCNNNNSLHLHKEIEDLKERVHAKELHIVQMETNVLTNAEKYPNGEYAALFEEMMMVQDKYDRLFENHRRLQKVNQGLEDKLLKIVDKYETEKNSLNRDIANLTARLVEARISLTQLEEENELYRNDCNIAVQLLQCKPSNFVAHKLETFPIDLQQKAKVHLNSRKNKTSANNQPNHSTEARTIRVPIPTFPPTAMVYSVSENDLSDNTNKNSNSTQSTANGHGISNPSNDVVSAAIMAKVLEERAKERNENGGCCSRRYSRCTCKCRSRKIETTEMGCQTQLTIPQDITFGSNSFISDFLQFSQQRTLSSDGTVPVSPTSLTAAVHLQRKPDVTSDFNCPRKWTRSGSSTSTETEI